MRQSEERSCLWNPNKIYPRVQTDSASVLHEAATCIKHLHKQIQVSQMLRCISFLLNGHATLVHETESFELYNKLWRHL